MKRIAWIGVGLVIVVAGIVALVFFLTGGLVETADNFFNAVKAGDITQARSYLSEDFKASTDEKALTDFLSRNAILRFKEASWSERNISGNRGELNGSITTDTGGVVPIRLTFVKENDGWKIFSMHKPAAGLQSESASPAVPAQAELVSLVHRSMKDFAVSVNGKSMDHFRKTISQVWQQQASVDQLNAAFGPIMEAGVDLTVLDQIEPTIDGEAQVDDSGVLLVKGTFPTQPSQVHFEHKYIYEGVDWRLVGFNIQIK